MNIFTDLAIETTTDGYYVRLKDFKKIYSDRSLKRESVFLKELLTPLIGTHKKLLWISPFHKEIYMGIPADVLPYLVWVIPATFTEIPHSNLANLISNQDDFLFFLNEIKGKDSFAIQSHPLLRDLNLESTIKQLLYKSAVRIKTIRHFQKRWEYNHRRNKNYYRKFSDIAQLRCPVPDLFILGGPSVDKNYHLIRGSQNIWCADTALPLLRQMNVVPGLIFSIDAGHGSYEHFIDSFENNFLYNSRIVVDPLIFPAIIRQSFGQIYSYSHSNPLINDLEKRLTFLKNSTNDVYGIMVSVFQFLFKDKRLPVTTGLDHGPVKKITHLRGSAYHRRQYFRVTRITTPEKYFYDLSDRYEMP